MIDVGNHTNYGTCKNKQNIKPVAKLELSDDLTIAPWQRLFCCKKRPINQGL